MILSSGRLPASAKTMVFPTNQREYHSPPRYGDQASEMVGLLLTGIDWNSQRIKIRGKGDKKRRIYLSPAAQKALLRYLSYQRDVLPQLWVTEERQAFEHPWDLAGAALPSRKNWH